MLRLEHAHEPQACYAIELAGIEEHRRHVELPLELFEQGRRPIEGEERARADDKNEVARRLPPGSKD